MAAAGVMVVVVGLFWVFTAPSTTPGDTVSAEITGFERAQSRPTPTAVPSPTPPLITPAGTEEAPNFRGIVRWLNSEPLTLEEQQGKVVLIDFWTYS